MSEIVEKIKNSKAKWYWSLKPGFFVDEKTGKDPFPEMVKSPWSEPISRWNSFLIETCNLLAVQTFGKVKDTDVLYIPDSIHYRMTSENLSKWNGVIERNNEVPFNMVLIASEEASAIVNVLNINEKGNLI